MLEYFHMERKLIFLDTETTGNTPADRLCQICYKINGKTVNELYKPPVPIGIESMSIHHITEEMVAEKPAFIDSSEYKELEEIFKTDTVFVAHNAKFDIGMLVKEGLSPKTVIDTYRVARYLDSENKIPSYRLQYLRYFLKITVDAVAHDAFGDVLVLEKLFERLVKKLEEKESLSYEAALERMIEISSHPVLFTSFNFGKYKGETVESVAARDRGYLQWMLDQKKQNPDDEEDWIYTLETYLKVK